MNNEIIVTYNGVPSYKRILSIIIDLFLKVILSLALISLISLIYKSSTFYIDLKLDEENVMIESRLHIKESDDLVSLVSYIDEKDIEYKEKYELIKKDVDYFFIDLNAYFDEINKGEKELKNLIEESNLYEIIDDDYVLKDNVTYLEVYLLYKENIYTEAINYLFNNLLYKKAITLNFIYSALIYVGSYLVSLIIVNYIIPLVLKRGKKSLGDKILNIAHVNKNGISLSFKEYTLYFLFYFFIEVILSIFSFFIPLIVSLFMIVFSKNHVRFSEYVLNYYSVSSLNSYIYLNKDEYFYLNKDMDNK